MNEKVGDLAFRAGPILVAALLATGAWSYFGNILDDDRPRPAAPISDRPTLVMFETESCGWCRKFHREAAPAYATSSYAARAPLRTLHVATQDQDGYRLKGAVRTVPTFVMINREGVEVGRIRGYPGSGEAFMGLVAPLVAKAER